MARSSFGPSEANNEANKKRGCYRAGTNSPNRNYIKKPLFIKDNFDSGRTLADTAERVRMGQWLPGLDSNQRPFD
jgi:hypothetical protein